VVRYRGVDGMFDVDGRRVVVCEGYAPSHLILACTVAELAELGKTISPPAPMDSGGSSDNGQGQEI